MTADKCVRRCSISLQYYAKKSDETPDFLELFLRYNIFSKCRLVIVRSIPVLRDVSAKSGI